MVLWSQGNDYTAGNGETVQADFQRASFGTELDLKLLKSNKFVYQPYTIELEMQISPALPMDLRKDDTWLFNPRHDSIQINHDKLQQSWNTTIFGSFVDHLMDNLLKPLDPRMFNAETSAKTYNFGGRTEGVWRLNTGALYAGADLRIEGADGTRITKFYNVTKCREYI